MTVRDDYLDAARRLERSMLHDGETTRRFELRKLTGWFGAYRPSEQVRTDIKVALEIAGLSTMPDIETLQDPGSAIAVRRTPKRVREPQLKRDLGEVLHLSIWRPGQDVQIVPADRVADLDPINLKDQLTWFHLDLRGENARLDQDVIFEFLAERCPGITPEVVDDLFSPDTLAGVRRHGVDKRVRVVSIPEITIERNHGRVASVAAASESASGSKCGVLRRRMTEIAAGGRWVLTVWHAPTWHGKGIDRERPFVWTDPIGPDPQYPAVVDLVLRRWEVAEGVEGGFELAMMILLVIANGHAEARRAMYSWLDDWDADFYLADARLRRGENTEPLERATLLDLRQMLTLFRTDAVALNSPQAGIENAWFPGRREDAEQFNAMIDRTIGDLRDLSDGIRTSFDLLSTAGMEQALTVARAQEEHGETLNRLISSVGLFLLGPSLVAALLAVPDDAFDARHVIATAFVFVLGVLVTAVAVVVGRSRPARLLGARFAERGQTQRPGESEVSN